MVFYFTAFNLLEATLPSLVSKQASPESKGAAMGIYSSSQFLGIFAGGSLAGVLFAYAGVSGVLLLNTLAGMLWVGVCFFINPDAYEFTHSISIDHKLRNATVVIQKLQQLPGVISVSLSETQQHIYLRIAKDKYNEGSAEHVIQNTDVPFEKT